MSPSKPTVAGPRFPNFFDRYAALIDQGLRSEFVGRQSGIYTTLQYYLGWTDIEGNPDRQPSGKVVRPTLCLLSCEAAGGNPEQAVPAAVSLEFIHNFSLIHDDIEDCDRTRHHRDTVWVIWGIPTAIVSGNTIFSMGDIAVQNFAKLGIPANVAIEVANTLTIHYLSMMEGQYLDISFEERSRITVPEYLEMIRRKTGALIECAVYTGAAIGGAMSNNRDIETISGLRSLGRELGYIFQIRDDMLGVWGGPETGKPVGADIRRRKKALPAVHAINHATGVAANELESIYSSTEIAEADVQSVMALMDDLGTRKYCEELAKAHWQKAQEVLKSVKLDNSSESDFRELGEFLLTRQA